jgi:hypothetical protein
MHYVGYYWMNRFVRRVIPPHSLHSGGKDCIYLANLKHWRLISKQQLQCLGAGTVSQYIEIRRYMHGRRGLATLGVEQASEEAGKATRD